MHKIESDRFLDVSALALIVNTSTGDYVVSYRLLCGGDLCFLQFWTANEIEVGFFCDRTISDSARAQSCATVENRYESSVIYIC